MRRRGGRRGRAGCGCGCGCRWRPRTRKFPCPSELNVERHERVAGTREKDCLLRAEREQNDGVNALTDKCLEQLVLRLLLLLLLPLLLLLRP